MRKNLFFIVTAIAFSSSVYSQKFTKEVTQEVPAAKGGLVRVISSSRKLDIKSWNQPKVKITAVIGYDTVTSTLTDEGWFEEMGIAVKPFSNRVDILSRSTAGSSGVIIDGVMYDTRNSVSTANGQAVKDLVTKTRSLTTSKKPFVKTLTVMIPEGSNLDIDEKYGDVVIGVNVNEAAIEMNNGMLDAQDIKKLKLKAQFCNANLGNVETAEVEFNNGTLRAQQINELDMESRSSSIEYTKGNYAYLRSQSDNISIDEINKVDGRKSYGSLRIEKLNNTIELEGNNFDLKLRNISPTVELVKIDNRYGDLRLPVRNLQNYFVNFRGSFSTVFAPFEKVAVKEETPAEDKEKKELKDVTITATGTQHSSLYSSQSGINGIVRSKGTQSYSSSNTPSKFTSSVGDVKGKHTKFEIVCQSCTLDFK